RPAKATSLRPSHKRQFLAPTRGISERRLCRFSADLSGELAPDLRTDKLVRRELSHQLFGILRLVPRSGHGPGSTSRRSTRTTTHRSFKKPGLDNDKLRLVMVGVQQGYDVVDG